jgi:Flp pilus assembly protein TadD
MQTYRARFEALKVKNYDVPVTSFRAAAKLSPQRTDIHKNLAYTLLKTGDTDAAREEFGIAVQLDPADSHTALEYAFLCYEAKEEATARKAEARRIFLRIERYGRCGIARHCCDGVSKR